MLHQLINWVSNAVINRTDSWLQYLLCNLFKEIGIKKCKDAFRDNTI